MPINAQLLSGIQAALTPAITANFTSGTQGDDLYEAYAWSVVLEAARAKGATIRYKQVRGPIVNNTFTFPTSPRELWWQAHPYAHAEIEFPFPGCPVLEAHVGIYVAGKSAARHECDVAVIYKGEADTCRAAHVLPRPSRVILAIECKYYLLSKVGVALARGFLGLRNEIEKKDRFFVATSGTSSVTRVLVKHAQRDHELQFSPLQPHQVDLMRGCFEQVFAGYVAPYLP